MPVSHDQNRIDHRRSDEVRPVRFRKNTVPVADGSVLIEMGNTHVLCGVSLEDRVPPWMRQKKVEGGWLTAEYAMLPYASGQRSRREGSSGKPSGRSQEIQRLIGRSLRAVTDLKALGSKTIWIDCDVLQADGGTRTAAVTGAFAALRLAVTRWVKSGRLEQDPILDSVAAISVGFVEGRPLLDLCYEEDVRADVDMNVVMTGSGRFVELQGTAEAEPFSHSQLTSLISLAADGITELHTKRDKVPGLRQKG